MLVIVKDSYEEMSREAARYIADRLRKKPNLVLGLATGSTPLGLYRELARMHREEGLDFSKVTTFNLDEYVGLPPEHDQSYHYFMQENFFKHINLDMPVCAHPHGYDQGHRCLLCLVRTADCRKPAASTFRCSASGRTAISPSTSPVRRSGRERASKR